jgi:hypothetical protein
MRFDAMRARRNKTAGTIDHSLPCEKEYLGFPTDERLPTEHWRHTFLEATFVRPSLLRNRRHREELIPARRLTL